MSDGEMDSLSRMLGMPAGSELLCLVFLTPPESGPDRGVGIDRDVGIHGDADNKAGVHRSERIALLTHFANYLNAPAGDVSQEQRAELLYGAAQLLRDAAELANVWAHQEFDKD